MSITSMSNVGHAGPQPTTTTTTTVFMVSSLSVTVGVISIVEKRIIVMWKTG
jgi:hypothetical protein